MLYDITISCTHDFTFFQIVSVTQIEFKLIEIVVSDTE